MRREPSISQMRNNDKKSVEHSTGNTNIFGGKDARFTRDTNQEAKEIIAENRLMNQSAFVGEDEGIDKLMHLKHLGVYVKSNAVKLNFRGTNKSRLMYSRKESLFCQNRSLDRQINNKNTVKFP